MAKPRVFITRVIPDEALESISQATDMEVWPEELPPSHEILLEKVRTVDGLLTMLTDKIGSNLIKAAPRLKVISNLAVGYDNIDIAEATRHKIAVGYTPGVLTEATADFAFTLLMTAARRVVEADNYTREKRWKTWGPLILLGQDIHHATLGIIGLGRIGAEVAKRAKGFNMNVLYYDRIRRNDDEEKRLGVKYVPELGSLLSSADFISVHVPLLAQNKHMIGVAEFAMMKPTAIFVNTSRGSVVDQKALYQALKSKQIFAAAVDVSEIEPIPSDDPLLTLKNIIVTPHIASASFTSRENMALLAADNLLAGLRGELPANCVNAEALRG